MRFSIDCQKRAAGSKPNALRRGGLIPAVLYGHNGQESLELTVSARDAEFLVRDVTVRKSEIQVNVPELSWQGKAYLQEVQAHPARGTLYHLSFFAVPA
jgi:large subunit ribosomal protein L25